MILMKSDVGSILNQCYAHGKLNKPFPRLMISNHAHESYHLLKQGIEQ